MLKKSMVEKTVRNHEYPYCISLANFEREQRCAYILQIDELAKAEYNKPEKKSNTLNYSDLTNRIEHVPSAWLVLIDENEQLNGYAHIQLISRKQAKELEKGSIDENSLTPLKNASDKKLCIHIGSIVTVRGFFNGTKPLAKLIAALTARIVDLREKYPQIKFIYCSAYENAKGKRVFEKRLPEYGFDVLEKNIGDEPLYRLDLESTERPFSQLISIVGQAKAKYHKKKAKKDTSEDFTNLIKLNEKHRNRFVKAICKICTKYIPIIFHSSIE